ncbi:hypothetical protein ONJ16_25395, partial [Salmonella enterica subsp. enterica serovar Montevideo]|nr:hypothetical protein [Salmonella enterica subsp. enterica serovar Montevideo]
MNRIYLEHTPTRLNRDNRRPCQFNGRNMEELRCQYRLSQPQIYQIIARQRKLHTRRHQPDLF